MENAEDHFQTTDQPRLQLTSPPLDKVHLYLIVDKNGVVVEKLAYRPGMQEKLYNNQIPPLAR